MKKLLTMLLVLSFALPALSGPRRWAPPRPPVMRAHPGPWRPAPPPFRPRFEPAVAGILGVAVWALAPRPVWIPGHFETRTVLVNGVLTAQQVWVPGYYVWR